MTAKRALLINPPTGLYIREDRCQSAIKHLRTVAMRPPTDLLYMAATLEQIGVDCRVQDYPVQGGDWTTLQEDLRTFDPHYVFISITTPSIHKDMETCEVIKSFKPDMLTVAKGAHFSVYDLAVMEQYPHLDVAIRGESELVAQEIGRSKAFEDIYGITFRKGDRIVRNPDRPFLHDLVNCRLSY